MKEGNEIMDENVKPRIFVTADLHFDHKRIISFERSQFATIEDHNETLIRNYNAVVGPNDICYILGDFGFGDPEHLKMYSMRLNGYKIFIFGNHDQFSVEDAYWLGFNEVYTTPIYLPESKGKIILSHEPVREALNNPYVINVHGHLHNSQLHLRNYFNVNVARTGYRPKDMAEFIRKANKFCKRRGETFGCEWYADFYTFDDGSKSAAEEIAKKGRIVETLK